MVHVKQDSIQIEFSIDHTHFALDCVLPVAINVHDTLYDLLVREHCGQSQSYNTFQEDHIFVRMPMKYPSLARPQRPAILVDSDELQSWQQAGTNICCRFCGTVLTALDSSCSVRLLPSEYVLERS